MQMDVNIVNKIKSAMGNSKGKNIETILFPMIEGYIGEFLFKILLGRLPGAKVTYTGESKTSGFGTSGQQATADIVV